VTEVESTNIQGDYKSCERLVTRFVKKVIDTQQ
jgi:hypothetical protein